MAVKTNRDAKKEKEEKVKGMKMKEAKDDRKCLSLLQTKKPVTENVKYTEYQSYDKRKKGKISIRAWANEKP